MIDEIFELIMKEARTREGQGLEQAILEVLLEVIRAIELKTSVNPGNILAAFKPLQVDDIKPTRLLFRRTQ